MAKNPAIDLVLNLKAIGAEKIKDVLRVLAKAASNLKNNLNTPPTPRPRPNPQPNNPNNPNNPGPNPNPQPNTPPGGNWLSALLSKLLSSLPGFLGKIGKGAVSLLGGLGPVVGKLFKGALGWIGGALGGIGGAIGGIALKGLTSALKVLGSIPFSAIVGGMAQFNGALKALLSSLGPIGSILGSVRGAGSTLKSFGNSLGPLGVGLSMAGGAIESVAGQVQEFLSTTVQLVSKARPGLVKRLQVAIEDTAAVMGHRLAPIVEIMTKVVRGIGDMLQTILPKTSDFREALAPLGDMFNTVKEALLPVGEVIRISLVVSLKVLAASLKLVANTLELILYPLIQLGKLSELKWKTSVGAAARPVTFTSPEDYAKEVYKAAAIGGKGADERTAENTNKMVGILDDIRNRLAVSAGPNATAAAVAASPAAALVAIRSWLGL